MTRILVLYYSQTGQLTRALRSMMAPLESRADVDIVWQALEPEKQFPFPWTFFEFLDAFPESVYLDPPLLKPVAFDPDVHFDLVILAYQVWFLSPSLPITAFLKSDAAHVLAGKPVITFIACRNMWLTAHEKVKGLLQGRGAHLLDNVVLTDQGPPWATFITTPRWLLTGRKDAFWFFPPAGIPDEEIRRASRFGHALGSGLHLLQSRPGAPLLTGLQAVQVQPGYVASERIGHRSFLVWGRLLRAIGRPGNRLRRIVLAIYCLFLITMIATVVPVGILVRALARPFFARRMDADIARLEQPSGSGTERLEQYSEPAGR